MDSETHDPHDPRTPPDHASHNAPSAPARPTPTIEYAIDVARLLSDDKCEDVLVLDVRGISQAFDVVIIGTGTSDRQIRGVATDVEKLAKERGYEVFGRSRDDRSTWVVLDFVDIVVHLFEPNTRAFYDLETLWGDAPHVDWRRPAGQSTRPGQL